ncbi:hypothetical protein LOD99_3579 [Oopsacas minuta]|uniref:ABC transporter domain-containing protein n=1 Tax=Oopsacas minuta TaxID=111878 RepID=A0AAV7JY15_9METZ|nr:hypothetical protein LOD99_3579 [Oopsacas minuta]
MGCFSFLRTVGLLLIKNFILQFRSWVFTIFELILPVAYIAVLVALRYQFVQIHHEERRWNPISINNSTDIDMKLATIAPMVFPMPTSLQNSKKIILFAPDTREVRDIAERFKSMGYFLNLFIDVDFRKNESEMVNFLDSQKNDSDEFYYSKYLGGISLNNTKKANSIQFEYKIRFDDKLRPFVNVSKLEEIFNVTNILALIQKLQHIDFKNDSNATEALKSPSGDWRTNILFPRIAGQGPRVKYDNLTGDKPGYIYQGYLPVQAALEQAILRYRYEQLNPDSSYPELNIQIQQYPYRKYIEYDFSMALAYGLPLLLMLSFIIPTMFIVRSLVYEKEKKLKESLKIMGASGIAQKLAWFLKNFIFLLVTIIMVMILIVGGGIFIWASNALFFLFLLLYTLATIGFATLLATLFSKTNVATVMSGVIFFMTYCPYFFIQSDETYDELPYQVKIILCLFSNTALALGSRLFSEFEARGDSASFSSVSTSPIPGDQFSLMFVLIILWFDFKFYTILAWYIDNVFPGDFGVPKPFYFLCMPSYWYTPKKKLTKRIQDRSEFIESEPKYNEVGIEIIDLSKTFGGLGQKKKKAVDGINLKMYKNQITVLLGHNGAGKTTTMSMLTGIYPPSTGTAEVNNFDIRSQISKVRRSLGLCPQHDVLYDNMTVREHLWFFGMLKGLSWKDVKEEAVELMIALGIYHKARVYTKNLSGGMKRKLSVGIALIGKSKVVILDEPTTGMDPGARRDTWDLLLRYKQDKTIMLTTHYMDEADFLGDRIAIMASGKIKCCGSPLFLKSKFGVGYHMTCVKEPNCNVPAITQLITQHVPEAKLQSNIGAELTYILPKNRSQAFPTMFDILQNNKEDYGITSYGVSITTMEEVFLHVGSQEDEELELLLAGRHLALENSNGNAQPNSIMIDKIDPNISLNNVSIERTKIAIQNSRQTPTKEKISEISPLSSPHRLRPVTGHNLWFLQFYAMFVKRIHNTTRNYKAIIPQLLLPCIFTLLALVVSIIAPGMSEQRALQMTPNLYRESNIPIISDLSTTAQSRNKAMQSYLNTNSSANILYMNASNGTQMEDFILKKYNKLSNTDVDQSYQFGAEYRGPNVTVWFSNQGYHMLPLAVNQVYNSLLRSIPGGEDDEIVGYNAPLPADLKSQADSLLGIGVGFSVAFDMVFGMAFLASSFVVFVVDERSSKAKHIQRVSGVHLSSFWLSGFLWDIINYVVPCVFILILFAAFQVPAYKDENLPVVALLLLLYGWSIIPLMYLFSYFFNTATTAFVLTVLFNIATGCAAVLIIFLLEVLQLTDASDIMKWIFLFMPNYCLGQALSDMVANTYYKNICAENAETREFCKLSGIAFQDVVLALETPGIGRFVIAMVIEGFVFLLGLYILESNIIQKIFKLIMSPCHKMGPRYIVDANGSGTGAFVDSDVLNEQANVTTEDMSYYTTWNPDGNILTLYNIGKVYRNTFTVCDRSPTIVAVDDLCLEVKRGEIFGLLGQNGAGKSSTFKMITGDEDISSGAAFINGIDLRYGIEKASHLMGYCPQYDALIDRMTGREVLLMFGRIRGLKGPGLNLAVNEIIERLYLSEYKDRLCGTYSGGNKRKLCTGIALVGGPPLVLLDEPTSGMDPVSKRLLWDTLTEYSQEGHCIVITSHSMEECEALCHRMTIMVNGRMKCLGTLQHLKNKFGSGYTLTVKCKQGQEELIQHISARFPENKISRSHTGMINFKIPQHAAKLSEIFACMEEAKNPVENYGVTQTTLEQVFLDLTAEQEAAEN